MKVQFYLRFHTKFGQSLWISGSSDDLGNDQPDQALAMTYMNEEFWQASIELKKKDLEKKISYRYYLKDEEGEMIGEAPNGRFIGITGKEASEITFIDTWNHAGEYENVFFTLPFQNVLLDGPSSRKKQGTSKAFSHTFKVKAPLLEKHQAVCLLGSDKELSAWDDKSPVILNKEGDWWVARLYLKDAEFPISYKYGVYDTGNKKFIRFEDGNNRFLFTEGTRKKTVTIHDGFVHLPNNTWKGAGVAIPVFSLRSRNSFGVGEFADIKLLVDWAKATGLRMIQLLPVNDTIATNTIMDSYPYAAISAFALHPLYINLFKVAGKEFSDRISSIKRKQAQLNALTAVDYEEVIKFKSSVLKELYELMGEKCLQSEEYLGFFKKNQHWLEPYACFCYFRDKYGTSHFEEWKQHGEYNAAEMSRIFNSKSAAGTEMGLYCFIQFHLHLQLKEAADYAHKKGIILKGDIPIGVYRYGCDAWTAPELYHMEWQAGAPPDDFAATGQNWGFPTYNWKKMQEDGFLWWKQRFEQMSEYFDAFRIDHILGFFRIWSIPENAVQGIMGRFVPCVPVHINEFGQNGIWFDYQRYCKPFINDEIINETFGEHAEQVKEVFLQPNEFHGYDLKEEFSTQRQIEKHFSCEEGKCEKKNIEQGLYDLVANVILFEEENSDGQHFHFRISMNKTSSFRYLDQAVRDKLNDLYINYFYRRQDEFWKKEAMHKLPRLKASTNMMVCGEDLGMVPHCVPEVMKNLGILSLEIQRMPKDPAKEFFHPDEAPYLSVITPSTHDMSTIRGWWEENRERTQHFYNSVLNQWGEAPVFCESWINRAIVLQHLYSPAMWSIFQLQDIMGMSETLRRENPQEERINDPANPKNYWQYRMHISLEDLLKNNEFNEELKGYIHNSGRSKN